VVSGWIEWFDNMTSGIRKHPEQDIDIKIVLTDNCHIVHTACMIRKSILVENNFRYEEQYSPAEDYQLWARLMDVTDFYNLPMVLAKYRLSGYNTSVLQKQKMENAHKKISVQISDKHLAFSREYEKKYKVIRINLFGVIPFLKIRKLRNSNSRYCLLFGLIPLFRWV